MDNVVVIRRAQDRRNKNEDRIEKVIIPKARYLKLIVAARAAKNFAENFKDHACEGNCWVCDVNTAVKDLEGEWEVM